MDWGDFSSAAGIMGPWLSVVAIVAVVGLVCALLHLVVEFGKLGR
jgi:hypothetical protein